MIPVMQQALALDGVTSFFRPAGFAGESRSLRLYVLVFADVSHADEDEEGTRGRSNFISNETCVCPKRLVKTDFLLTFQIIFFTCI